MDFTLTGDQRSLQGLAQQILAKEATQERLDALDAQGSWFDEALWKQLADAGLVGAALKEDVGGGGLGLTELALVLEQVGAHAAQVPLLEVLVPALALDRFGSDDQRQVLRDLVSGNALVVAALTESGREDPARPATTAVLGGGTWTVNGSKSAVPLLDRASKVVVSAATATGPVLLLVEASGTPAGRTTHGLPVFDLELDGTVAELLTDDPTALDWLLDRARVAIAATALGVSNKALRLSATYTTEREQFGRAVATFQAVGHRLADAYIDVEAIRLTTLQAVWLLDEGLPAHDEARIAKWWAAEGGHRVAHAAQHVHGGVGIDMDYVLHRYFTWSKYLEFTLGGATAQAL
ncbi:MAG: 3-oxocholest-4-en-26-oyl-CoA dehydrogenase beta subunit, partial [Frankiales bacterium]|nr:3-oxocholest-4-en-26-oyl-CoA dehydrogenase beta subunit [Frankiales bacterium]